MKIRTFTDRFEGLGGTFQAIVAEKKNWGLGFAIEVGFSEKIEMGQNVVQLKASVQIFGM